MKFRCYACTFQMNDGPPPLEALSNLQAIGVGMAAPEVDYHMFDGTMYEGMSPYQFCSFCLTAFKEFPSITMKGGDRHELKWGSNSLDYPQGGIHWQNVKCLTCWKEIYRLSIDTSKDESYTLFDDCLRARAGMIHQIEVLYPNANTTELYRLFKIEA